MADETGEASIWLETGDAVGAAKPDREAAGDEDGGVVPVEADTSTDADGSAADPPDAAVEAVGTGATVHPSEAIKTTRMGRTAIRRCSHPSLLGTMVDMTDTSMAFRQRYPGNEADRRLAIG